MSNCIPDTLYAKIRVKRSLVPGEIPNTLQLGEIAVNIPDRKLYIGNEFKNPVLLNFTSGGGSGTYVGGQGITISSLNIISFEQSTLPSRYIEVSKIKEPNNASNGYLYFNGSGWVLDDAPSLTLEQLFACIGGYTPNLQQYYIDGGSANNNTIWCTKT